jgi:DegV family protein with EDD domain
MTLGIVTDSTCDIPSWLLEEYGIEVIPSVLIMDGVEYVDGEGMTRDEFYARLPGLRTSPTTAAASIGEFVARYDALLTRGVDQILSIHAPEVLTSIINTARQAAQAFPGKVTCVDSGSLSLGLGFQVLAAAEAAASGSVPPWRDRVHAPAASRLGRIDTMEYVKHAGASRAHWLRWEACSPSSRSSS